MRFAYKVVGLLMASFCVLAAPPALPAQAQPAGGARKEIALASGWEFRELAKGPATEMTVWRSAKVPGDVQMDLFHHKLIPNPFFRENETGLQWIGKADWEYRDTITATPAMLAYRHIDLVFKGLDTFADVYVNDKKVLSADDMFRDWRVDIKPELKPGANTLRVVFHSVFPEMDKLQEEDKFASVTHEPGKNYIRKAAYQFGWDWAPRFVTSGIWRPVHLSLWNGARISDLYIEQKEISAPVADVVAKMKITSSVQGEAAVTVEYGAGGKPVKLSRTVVLKPGVNPVEIPIDIAHPKLWYPAGYGPHRLYHFDAQVRVSNRLADRKSVETGLRSVVLRRVPDKWGASFEFIVNGIPVFAKGASVIPMDSFPSQVTNARIRRMLQSVRDANMNMIRLWGGGYYETPEFYHLCDQMGIMIWHDFMFAYLVPYSIRKNATADVEYQLRRLRNHPSIVIWIGNNELEWLATGLGRRRLGSEATQSRIELEYLAFFSGIIPKVVAQLDPSTPYWPSSPSAGYEWPANTQKAGDVHSWTVWHGNAPPESFEKSFPRFESEYGMQSFPDMRTIDSFTLPKDRSYDSPVMKDHQRDGSGRGNEIIRDYILKDFPAPKNFRSFVYLSQVMQADAIKLNAEHLRRDRPRTMGSLFWQLNDCWPAISWSSIDYYGRWKALQYYARRFYNPLLVSPYEENGSVAVYVVSDRLKPASANLRVRLMTFDGAVLKEKSQPVEIPALSSKIYVQWPMEGFLALKGYSPESTFVSTELTVNGKTASRNLLFFAHAKNLDLPSPRITSALTGGGGSYQLRLTSNALARDVYVSAGDLDVRYSNNFFNLLPGETREITLETAATLQQLRASLKIVSLTDAFAPAAPAAKATAQARVISGSARRRSGGR
jgi:beta-mannosidase